MAESITGKRFESLEGESLTTIEDQMNMRERRGYAVKLLHLAPSITGPGYDAIFEVWK